jgi:hypothetical protein
LRENGEILASMTAKHLKTVGDVHEVPVIAIKFFGDLSYSQKKISVVSSDLDGVVYLTYYSSAIIGYQTVKQCFMKKRVGPTFSIAPFILNTLHRQFINSSGEHQSDESPYQLEEQYAA